MQLIKLKEAFRPSVFLETSSFMNIVLYLKSNVL